MKKIILLLLIPFALTAQSFYGNNPFAHTYSIVAYDSTTGEIGVAVQSHWFSVGTVVCWGEAGVGVVATQSFVNVSFGPRGLELLKEGLTPGEAVDKLLSDDEGREYRQLAILDAKGNVAAFTGKNCIQPAGHIVGKGYSVQANLMSNDKIWGAMSKAFENSEGPLAERMVAALEAAENAGGDIRGKQSAALLVFSGKPTGKIWLDKLVDLRVDDHPEPIKEIKRLLKVHRAYEHMNNGDLAVEKNDMETAMKEYSAAMDMFPDNLEMKYWTAVTLANNDRIEDALILFKEVFDKDKNWKTLTPRLVPSGLLKVTDENLKLIMNL
ncbi:secreted protein containing DUF1028 [Melioribacter roseus P3M-2]|uniref:Secreted protein containing DUF1028 n=1 Tax=Melioribacter roseus (strain DSM 23840 / JCM 17771 / VKM B-2668 / P3M-2) TaxID=1191523 RepID=I6YSX2_MELRP|nr:DUF1028 domain-containing protein [Melioribacter roseus]AFN73647.1 secreted protein containing DUF1028 [Melioribacter roseus P3M-2]